MNETNREVQLTFFVIILDYSLFAFMVNLVRELVKDIEDTEGDKVANYHTISTKFGIPLAKYITFGLNLINTGLITTYLITYFYKNNALVIYFLTLIVAPLLFVSVRLLQAQESNHFGRISSLLKEVMVAGICSMIVFKITQS